MRPGLFNQCSEFILKELEEIGEEISVNGRRINNIRYGVDTVHLASLETGLKVLLNAVQSSSENFDLNLNINETKVIVLSNQSPDESSIFITANNSKIEQVKHLYYLGSWLTQMPGVKKK